MKKFIRKIGCVLTAAAMMAGLAGCAGNSGSTAEETSAADSGAETSAETEAKEVTWDELDQTAITKAMGMGWNLGNQLEATNAGVPSETAWGNPVITEDLIKTVREQGFDTVRIPVSYLLKIGEGPDYTIDEEWLNRVQEVVDYVVDNDMFAIINIHGDGYYTVDKAWLLCVEDDEAQKEIKAKYEAVWRQIAERFKDYDEHLIFESMNEVHDDSYQAPKANGYKNINDYNKIFVDTIRKTGSNNAKRWLLMPGWNTNIDHTVGDYGFEIPEDTLCEADGKRIMISVHYYDPYNFTIDSNIMSIKTQWGKYAVEDYDNWGQEDYVDKSMKKLYDAFVSQGYPVVIGELGVQDKSYKSESFGEFRRYWTEYVVKAAKDNGCVPVYWDNGWNGENGFGLINRSTLEITQPECIEAMMRAVDTQGDYEIAAPKGFEKSDEAA